MLAFAVSPLEFDPKNVHCYPVGFAGSPSATPLLEPNTSMGIQSENEGSTSVWYITGAAADWYLAPVTDGYAFTKALYDLTGAPKIPPRYAMAFMATYWGYSSMQEVEGYMHKFREGAYPIDSFIMDYDWFGPKPCGPDGAQGDGNCGDYGYKGSFWYNQTFVQPDGSKVVTTLPSQVLSHFHSEPLNMKFAGIRKPRSYSNINFSNTSGWLLPDSDSVGAGGNNWNYTIPAFRDWFVNLRCSLRIPDAPCPTVSSENMRCSVLDEFVVGATCTRA
eukprot:m.402856 g.402856  ORF g.402856 m.402856 type:complete len:276 (+) comp21185_c0_seq4:356-1183(+)